MDRKDTGDHVSATEPDPSPTEVAKDSLDWVEPAAGAQLPLWEDE